MNNNYHGQIENTSVSMVFMMTEFLGNGWIILLNVAVRPLVLVTVMFIQSSTRTKNTKKCS